VALVKLLRCNGHSLDVYDASPAPVYRVLRRPGGPPVKAHGWRLLADDAARTALRELLATGYYEGETPSTE
jgi:hypothetical protein